MSGASYKHYFETIGSTVLTDDKPASTYATLTTIDNVLHLVDSSPVYRINWVDNVGIVLPQLANADLGISIAALSITHQFPATIISEFRYPNYDVRVAASVTSSTLFMYAAIANPNAALQFGDPNVVGAIIAGTSSSTPSWALEATLNANATNVDVVNQTINNTEIADGHVGKPGVVGVMRAQLQLFLAVQFESTSGDSATLYGIQVREYIND